MKHKGNPIKMPDANAGVDVKRSRIRFRTNARIPILTSFLIMLFM
jgi:hypothetical protein